MNFLSRTLQSFKYLSLYVFLLHGVTAYCSEQSEISTDVLIVGGGPSGLTLANLCQKNGISYLLFEKNESTTTFSKATGLHANTME